jgi:hypothetical protein
MRAGVSAFQTGRGSLPTYDDEREGDEVFFPTCRPPPFSIRTSPSRSTRTRHTAQRQGRLSPPRPGQRTRHEQTRSESEHIRIRCGMHERVGQRLTAGTSTYPPSSKRRDGGEGRARYGVNGRTPKVKPHTPPQRSGTTGWFHGAGTRAIKEPPPLESPISGRGGGSEERADVSEVSRTAKKENLSTHHEGPTTRHESACERGSSCLRSSGRN